MDLVKFALTIIIFNIKYELYKVYLKCTSMQRWHCPCYNGYPWNNVKDNVFFWFKSV